MAGKRLGTGLGALFGDAAFDERSNDNIYVPISKIEPRKDQPRNNFDDESLAELAESIREHGIIQPLTVRKLTGGYYQIIAGERRWRASRIAGLSEVPVRIIEADDRKTMELALVENLQREDLNPVEEANGYKALIDEYGLTQAEIAVRVSKSRPVVANALRLLSLPEEILKYLSGGRLSLSLARIILELEDDKTRLEAAEIIISRDMTVREAEALIKKLLEGNKLKREKKTANDIVDYIIEVEKRLSKKLGRKVKIVDGKKKGHLELEYYGSDDFEIICSALENMKI